jgi:hypothetical protein
LARRRPQERSSGLQPITVMTDRPARPVQGQTNREPDRTKVSRHVEVVQKNGIAGPDEAAGF